MDLSRTHDRLISFAVSAMLTSAFLATAPSAVMTAAVAPQPQAILQAVEGLRAAGFQGTANVALPTTVAPHATIAPAANPTPADGPLLTDAQLAKLDGFMPKFGVNATLSKPVTDALGLTCGQETMTLRELAIDTHAPETKHSFGRTPAGTGFVFLIATNDKASTYLANGKQELVSAVAVVRTASVPAAIPVADAQKQLKDEIAFWMKTADSH